MTTEQQYEEDYKRTREEILATTMRLIAIGCRSPGSAAAVIGAARSVLAAVMTYAADGNESILLDLIDVVSKGLRSKTTDLTTEWKAELKRHGHRQ
jgi:hypothetical protein